MSDPELDLPESRTSPKANSDDSVQLSMDEQLTAYLDGELEPIEATSLEQRLVDDPMLRSRLANLRQAYDLLDELPETPADQRFTQSTLELVVKDLVKTNDPAALKSKTVLTSSSVRASWNWWTMPWVILTAMGLVMLGMVGGIAVRFNQMRQDFRDLGLIAALPGIQDVDSFRIASGVSEEKVPIEILKQHYGEKLVPAVPISTWQRNAWVKELGPLQIAKIDAGRESLRKLDRETYARLTSIQNQILDDPKSDALQEAVHIAGMVMDALPNTRRLDLESMTQEQRLVYLKEQMHLSAAMIHASQLSGADIKELDDWEKQYFQPALIQELQPPRSMNNRALIGLLWFRHRIENGFQLDGQFELMSTLIPKLSDTARSLIEGVNKNDQLGVLTTWLTPNRIVSTKTMLDEYDRIPRDMREEIDLADPQQTRRRVEEIMRRPNNRARPRP
jgi:hypothetical protein